MQTNEKDLLPVYGISEKENSLTYTIGRRSSDPDLFLKSTHLDDLPWPTSYTQAPLAKRAINALRRAGCETVGDVYDLFEFAVDVRRRLAVYGLGKESYRMTREVFRETGIELSDPGCTSGLSPVFYQG